MRMRLTGLGRQNPPIPHPAPPRTHNFRSLSLSLSSLGVSGWPDMEAAEPLRRLLVGSFGCAIVRALL